MTTTADASTITQQARDQSRWNRAEEEVDGKLDELAARTIFEYIQAHYLESR